MVSGVGLRDPGAGFRVESGVQDPDFGNPGPGFFFFLFFITLKPRVESYKSLWAYIRISGRGPRGSG